MCLIFRGEEKFAKKLVHTPAVYQNRSSLVEKLLKTRANLPSCGESERKTERANENAIQEAIKTQLPVILREIGEW